MLLNPNAEPYVPDANILTAEMNALQTYTANIDNATNPIERAYFIKEFFTFLSNSKKLLTIPGLRDAAKSKMGIMSIDSELIRDIVRESIEKLCVALGNYEDLSAVPGCAPAHKKYKILGKGSFGAVFSPALPNLVNGHLTEFPDNVTKVFYEKESYNDALERLASVSRVIGNNVGHRYHTYTRKYKGKNLPTKLFNNLKTISNDFSPNTNLYAMRFPNLGVALGDLYKTSTHRQLRSIPVVVILEQMQKLLTQTANLARHRYLHTDIRETNIVANPTTGALTLIDFDWLRPYEYIYDEYPHGFYNNPPECLAYDTWDMQLTSKLVTDMFGKQIAKYVEYQYHVFGRVHASRGITGGAALTAKVIIAILENTKYLKGTLGSESEEAHFMDTVYPTFDNFGLAFSLLDFLETVYPGVLVSTKERATEENKINVAKSLAPFLKNNDRPYTTEELHAAIQALFEFSLLLTNLSSYSLKDRPTPDAAVREADRIVAAYKATLQSGGKRKKLRRTHRRNAQIKRRKTVTRPCAKP